jgi:hypothetical protein
MATNLLTLTASETTILQMLIAVEEWWSKTTVPYNMQRKFHVWERNR